MTEMWTMVRRATLRLLALLCFAAATPAFAHPHVWVTMQTSLVYGADGTLTGIRNAWTFDDMFSTYATQGLESKEKGVFTRDELKDLAEVNVSSLRENDFFTQAKLDGKAPEFADPTDYFLEYKDQMLTLHFTLPLKKPVKARDVDLDIYDPSYFVDFAFVDKQPFALQGAPASCKVAMRRPDEKQAAVELRKLDESAFAQDNSAYGRLFATKVTVRCP
jgi:ABC-type uncharacterized transport system substrate-binding protein